MKCVLKTMLAYSRLLGAGFRILDRASSPPQPLRYSLSPAWRREEGRGVTSSQPSTTKFGVWRPVKDVDEPYSS